MQIGVTATKAFLVGHGLHVAAPFELEPSVYLNPSPQKIDLDEVATAREDCRDYVAAVTSNELATFCIEVEGERGELLAVKIWNALRHFTY